MKRALDITKDTGGRSGGLDWPMMLACLLVGLLAGFGWGRFFDVADSEMPQAWSVKSEGLRGAEDRAVTATGSFGATTTESQVEPKRKRIRNQFHAGAVQMRASAGKSTVWLPMGLAQGFRWGVGSMHEGAFWLSGEAIKVLNLNEAEQAAIKSQVADFCHLIRETERKVAVYEENSETRVKVRIPGGVDFAEPMAAFTNQISQMLGEVRGALLLKMLQEELNDETPLFLGEEWQIEVLMLPENRFQVTIRSGASTSQSLTSELPDEVEHLVGVAEE